AHGAGSACGKALGAVPTSTIGYEKRFNPALRAATSEQHFVDFILAGEPEPPMYFAAMKRDNKVGPAILGRLPLPPRMTVDELRGLDATAVAMIDTRPWSAFRSGHVPGSLWLPLTKSFNSDAGSFITGDDDIYLIIAPGDVEEAVRDLIRIGLDRIKGWFDASELEQYEQAGGRLVPMAEVDVEAARELIEASTTEVLDVRRATEFAEGRIAGAHNIAHTRLASRLNEVPKDKHLVVNCRSGARSGRACAFLQRAGYQVTNLRGGILAWEQAETAVER
ncbi:MAG: hypothetical protein KC983_09190, partial [Phycisphaerales bacterium]|nr:hypothetical protein [Phycisphaerales bacterium]